MLAPTGVTAAQYWNAIKAGNRTHARITFIGQDIVLTDEDIDISEGIVIEDVLNGDTDLTFGKAVSKCARVRIFNSDKVRYLIWTGEFKVEFGVEISGTTRWVTVGFFTGDRPSNIETSDSVELVAYDRMTRFDILADDFVASVTYPITLENLYIALCNYVGVGYVNGNQLTQSYSRSFAEAPADMLGFTCRDILAMIAEACGCYARITNTGSVQLTWFRSATSHIVTRNEEFDIQHADLYAGMIWNEFDLLTWDEADQLTWDEVAGYYDAVYGVKAVKVKQVGSDVDIDYPAVENKNVYIINENPFLPVSSASDITNYVQPIYDRIKALGGPLPMRTECVGNWLVESGDIITIHLANEIIQSPIFCRTLTWQGSVVDVYETTGNKDRKMNVDSGKQRIMTSKLIRLLTEDEFYHVQSGVSIEPDGITVSGGKYVKIESGGVFDVESTNFSISSENKRMETGDWTFDSTGAFHKLANRTDNFQIAHNSQKKAGAHGIFYDSGRLWLVAKNLNATGSQGGSATWFVGIDPASCFYPGVSNGMVGISGHTVSVYTSDLYSDIGYSIFPKYKNYPNVGFEFAYYEPQSILEILGKNSMPVVLFGRVTSPSSRDIKHDIQSMPDVGGIIDALRPVSFVYDQDPSESKQFGLIFEETIKVCPEICFQSDDRKSINYVELVPVLLKEIKSLRERVSELERRLNK